MTFARIQTYAREEGIAIGEHRGEQKKALEAAKNLLKMNVLTNEQIAQAEGLSIDEVKQLAAEVTA